jgi:hypothetical protein
LLARLLAWNRENISLLPSFLANKGQFKELLLMEKSLNSRSGFAPFMERNFMIWLNMFQCPPVAALIEQDRCTCFSMQQTTNKSAAFDSLLKLVLPR